MFKVLKTAAVLGIVLVFTNCAKAPEEEINAARAALDTARQAEAETYVAEDYRNAEDALKSAMTEVEAQEGKFALLRSFDHATELLTKAEQEANDVAAKAETAKEEARESAEGLLANAQMAIDEAQAALKTAPSGKGTKAELEAMKSELDTLAAALSDAQQSFDVGDYLGAEAKAQSVIEKAGAISMDIAQAQTKKRQT